MDATDIMMESIKNNQQMVCQVGELIKDQGNRPQVIEVNRIMDINLSSE